MTQLKLADKGLQIRISVELFYRIEKILLLSDRIKKAENQFWAKFFFSWRPLEEFFRDSSVLRTVKEGAETLTGHVYLGLS